MIPRNNRMLVIILMLMCMPKVSKAQFSISAGGAHQVDNFFRNEGRLTFFNPAMNHYNGWLGQLDIQNNKSQFYFEFGGHTGGFHYRFDSSRVTVSPVGNIITRRYELNSDVSLAAYTFKAGYGNVFDLFEKNSWWWTLSAHGFVQWDVNNGARETNRRTFGAVTQTSGSLEELVYEFDDPAGNLFTFSDTWVQMGLELKNRFGWNAFFVELSAAMGIHNRLRLELSEPHYHGSYRAQKSRWNMQLSIKLGRTFNSKKQSVEYKPEKVN